MKTTDTTILKQFQSVLNRKILTEKIYNDLLKIWYLDKVDLDEEMQKINEKHSGLSRSRREAIPEFIKLREILNEMKKEEENSISFNNEAQPSLYQDTIVS